MFRCLTVFVTAILMFLSCGCTKNKVISLSKDAYFELHSQFSRGRGYTVDVAMDGTVLAPAGNSILFLSKDGGDSWDTVYADISGIPIVNEKNGEIIFVGLPYRSEILLDNPIDTIGQEGYIFPLYRSVNHGLTWEKTSGIIYKDANGWLPSSGGAENGITLKFGPKEGRLLMPARVFVEYERGTRNADHYNTAIYSDDNGKTWHTSAPFPEKGTGEGTLAELFDGRIYYNSRSHMAADAQRRTAWSYDGGETWVELGISVLPDRAGRTYSAYGCKGGLIRLPVANEDILVYSNLDIPISSSFRSNITVWASFDGGKTWPVKRLVYDGPSGYSMLAAGRKNTKSDGWIYIMFEGYPNNEVREWPDLDQYFARFNLNWIIGGELTGDGAIPMRYLK
jgi:sialidase-1